MTAIKHDQGKPRMSLVPQRSLVEVAKVMTFGADKYGDYNCLGGLRYTRLADAAQRHLNAWLCREDYDRESGVNHLAHAAANLLMLLEHQQRNMKDLDDRSL